MDLEQIAWADTPTTSSAWIKASEAERLFLVKQNSISYSDELEFISANDNGHVVVSLKRNLGPGERGTLLLDLEELLKNNLDKAITIWLEPKEDKSSLRKLRGIKVKK